MNPFSGYPSRPKSPYPPPQSQLKPDQARMAENSDTDPRGPLHQARPKLTKRISSFSTAMNYHQDQSVFFNTPTATEPFDYMPKENMHLYVGPTNIMATVTTLHGKIMSKLWQGLPPSDNGSLCEVFEAYRDLVTENEKLRAERDSEIEGRRAAEQALNEERNMWLEEEKDYKVDVKRLETIIAHSNHGIEGVIRARQQSVVRHKKRGELPEPTRLSEDDGRENVYEFLTSSKAKDKQVEKPMEKPVEKPTPRKTMGIGMSVHEATENTDDILIVSGASGPVQLTKKLLKKKFSTTSLNEMQSVSFSDDEQPTSLPASPKRAIGAPLKGHALRQRATVRSHANDSDAELELKPPATSSTEPRSSSDPIAARSRGGNTHTIDVGAGQRGTSATSGIDHAISQFKSWMPRKHQKKGSNVAGEVDKNIELIPLGQQPYQSLVEDGPQMSRNAERDLRRPLSFYAGDEASFQRRISAGGSRGASRHRSLSLSEVRSPPKDDTLELVDVGPTTSPRPASVDTIRPVMLTKPTAEKLGESQQKPAREGSRSSVSTTIHRPKNESKSASATPSSSQSESGDVLSDKTGGVKSRGARTEPARSNYVAHGGENQKASPAVVAAAKATAASTRKEDENTSPAERRKRKEGDRNKKM
ncbi:hypothetical protein NA57DRAFT_78371 [Rhizodiscina lignyota]|uniref:Uncharacterized protein n=1 Tax=Rhizodiscina lignyota TaxID=1504668 RepID=A0A9P4M4D9_9PEZI|nr:hypothetical protein NA57DRAFT_78371 [Rhizodiscina lignyota]